MKKLVILAILMNVSILLSACGAAENQINYDGKLRPVSEVEEIIADKLEVENPQMDLEVSIFEEAED